MLPGDHANHECLCVPMDMYVDYEVGQLLSEFTHFSALHCLLSTLFLNKLAKVVERHFLFVLPQPNCRQDYEAPAQKKQQLILKQLSEP